MIKNVVEELKLSEKTESIFEFQRGKNKSYRAKLSRDDNGIINVELFDIIGYNEKYLFKTVNNLLASSILPDARPGQIIWILYMDEELIPEKEYLLEADVYYYGVGNTVQNCNGRPLGETFNAIYKRSDLGLCGPGMGKTFFLFKLK